MDHYCTVRDMNHGIKPKDGPVLVTGASGGVGSIAAMILASMGYRVTASTGRPEEAAGVRYGSIVAACGMAQGMDLMGNVAPFILRGVTLKGIDSVMFAKEKRAAIWQQAVQYLPESRMDSLTTVYPLSDAITVAEKLLSGGIRGRAVIQCS